MTSHQVAHSPGNNWSKPVDISWWVWFVSIAALFFLDIIPTLPVVVFLAGSMVYVLARPGLALKAISISWIPWMYVIFAALSVLWSQYPDWTLRASIQFALSTAFFLVMARALPPKSLLTVFLSALLVVDAASSRKPENGMELSRTGHDRDFRLEKQFRFCASFIDSMRRVGASGP